MARTEFITRVEGNMSFARCGIIGLSLQNVNQLNLHFKCDRNYKPMSQEWVKVTVETISLCACGQEAQGDTDPPMCPDCYERKAGEKPVGARTETEELATEYQKENRRHERKGG